MTAAGTLRRLLVQPGPVLVPGAPNVLAARIAEEVGFNTVLFTGTDARAILGMEEACRRAAAYAAVGADVTFVEAPRTVDEPTAIPRSIPVPQLVNMVEGGKTPVLPARTLEEMGFKFIVYANSALRAAIKGMQRVLSGLARDGSTDAVLDQMVSWEERQRPVGLRDYAEFETRYT